MLSQLVPQITERFSLLEEFNIGGPTVYKSYFMIVYTARVIQREGWGREAQYSTRHSMGKVEYAN